MGNFRNFILRIKFREHKLVPGLIVANHDGTKITGIFDTRTMGPLPQEGSKLFGEDYYGDLIPFTIQESFPFNTNNFMFYIAGVPDAQ